jgi:hypothetical protein
MHDQEQQNFTNPNTLSGGHDSNSDISEQPQIRKRLFKTEKEVVKIQRKRLFMTRKYEDLPKPVEIKQIKMIPKFNIVKQERVTEAEEKPDTRTSEDVYVGNLMLNMNEPGRVMREGELRNALMAYYESVQTLVNGKFFRCKYYYSK